MFCGGKTAHKPDCTHGVSRPESATTTSVRAGNALAIRNAAHEIAKWIGTIEKSNIDELASIIWKHCGSVTPTVEEKPDAES
jgi:hypothetical protein